MGTVAINSKKKKKTIWPHTSQPMESKSPFICNNVVNNPVQCGVVLSGCSDGFSISSARDTRFIVVLSTTVNSELLFPF